ncbi:MAG: T9SS type A sorting domain-containing protein, partial [Saprospiraceae bacterium]|nr:T9SS type A sorting domain-containing protein [Saprospiraceae bacterium]
DSSGTYQVTLSATNNCGVAINNIPVQVIITGVDQLTLQGWKIQASPNPTAGPLQLQVEAPIGGDGTIQILNALGQVVDNQAVVIQQGQNNFPLDLGLQPSGAFQIKLQTALGSAFVRVIVNK